MDDHVHPETVAMIASMLVSAVKEIGLSAEPFGASMVWVCNPAADPPPDSDARTWRLNPGLRQAVKCFVDAETGLLGWHFVWHTPGAMPEYEWIALATDVNQVAARIARVLAVLPETAS